MRNGDQNQSTGERRYYWSEANPPTSVVIEAVARKAGVDSTALSPLYNVLDPDALDELFYSPGKRARTSDVRVSFVYAGYEVTVDSDGRVTVGDESE